MFASSAIFKLGLIGLSSMLALFLTGCSGGNGVSRGTPLATVVVRGAASAPPVTTTLGPTPGSRPNATSTTSPNNGQTGTSTSAATSFPKEGGNSTVQVGVSTANLDASLQIANGATDDTFDGIGGVVDSAPLLYAYPKPQRNQILDYLFKPDYGQAIQVLKLEIGGDSNTTVDSESAYQHSLNDSPNVMNGYEAWLAQEALKRNARIKIWGLQWGAPNWVDSICSQTDANYLTNWILLMKRQAGVQVDYISAGQNEKVCSSSAPLNDQQNISALRQTLDQSGLSDVKVIGYDGETGSNPPATPTLLNQPRGDLYALGVHYPGGWKAPLTWGSVNFTGNPIKARGIKYWASEDTDFQSLVPAPGTLTRQYNFRYLQYGTTLIMNWALVGAAYSNMDYMEHSKSGSPPQMALYAEEPWSGHYTIYDAPFWSMAHTTQFTEAGWVYVKSASRRLPKGGSIVSYRSGSGNAQDWTSVIETTDATAGQTVHLIFGSHFKAGNYSVFSSNDDNKRYFENVGTFSQADGGITISVKPHSIVTISSLPGRGKGMAAATAPPSQPFPTSYVDNFESYALGETKIGYLVPLQGAYEIQSCAAGRIGQCLTQVAAPNPIRWGSGAADPFILVGDATTTDSTISADIRLPDTNTGTYGSIGGHAGLALNRGYGKFRGYELKIYGGGTWELAYTDKSRHSLATGNLSTSAVDWHTLQLRFSQGKVTASIDGAVVSTPTSIAATLPSGMGALLSSFSQVQFDNFSISKN